MADVIDRGAEQLEATRLFLATHHPFAALAADLRDDLAEAIETLEVETGAKVYAAGDALPGFFAIRAGTVEITTPKREDGGGDRISRLEAGECFGERGLLLGGYAPYDATALADLSLYMIPAERFLDLIAAEEGFARFFGRAAVQQAVQQSTRQPGGMAETPAAAPLPPAAARSAEPADPSLQPLAALMTPGPICIPPEVAVSEAARVMRDKGISCVLIADEGRLEGILTASDLSGRVLAEGRDGTTPVHEVMTARPRGLAPESLGLDAVVTMLELGIGHLPVVEDGRPVGILTRTDLLMQQSLSLPVILSGLARADTDEAMRESVARVPALLARLVGSGTEHHVITRLVTDVSDALTRRLCARAEAALGPAPVPWLWLACGSQGRREQTGVSDQDNCLMLSDEARPEHDAYFQAFAAHVSDGLNACGFAYCPGEMMASTPRWRVPIATWREYFTGWIAKPDPTARMLASVMFDLRPIAGDESLFKGLHAETLKAARANSIFVAHMVANAMTHQPPLGLFRGIALIRSGEHRDRLDLKHNGVVPVVDLARLYALMGGIEAVPTRERLVAAKEAGVISASGGAELIDAYDLIAETRLRHQAGLIGRGEKPDNFMAPATLSDLERNHLREAFVVIKTMQSAVAQGRQTVV